jgi:hypothetical protein
LSVDGFFASPNARLAGMRAAVGKKKRQQPTASEKLSASTNKKTGCAFAFGVLVFMLGLGLLGNEIRSLTWRLKAKWYYREGQARIEKTTIVQREGSYDLDITYHLEFPDGRHGRTITRQEQDDPAAGKMEDAQRVQQRYPTGSLLRCWYSPEDPDGYNELAPSGLDEWLPIRRLWIPGAVLLLGVLLCRPLWRVKLSPQMLAELEREG